jgi:hypothetical protein
VRSQRIRRLTEADLTLQILAVLDRQQLDVVMTGWEEAMALPNSLAWITNRVLQVSQTGT